MKSYFSYSRNMSFYFLIIGVFLILNSPSLLSDGMFMDGLIFSTISKNLANGLGSFWNPYFTATCLPEFHQHPPLALGIQSIFYTIFGDSRYVDKFFSLLPMVLTGFILVRIWRILNYKYGWLPLFFWLLTPTLSWACGKNLLENTLTFFLTLSVFFFLKGQVNRTSGFVFFAGVMLSLGFLTKGFVAFFPWTLPIILWICNRQKSVYKIALETIGLIGFSLVPLFILILIYPVAYASLYKYITGQVIYSIFNVVTVDSRYSILGKLINELKYAVSISLVTVLANYYMRLGASQLMNNLKKGLVFILLGLSGVLPITISMKQWGFYIIPTFPFFAIGFAIVIFPVVDMIINLIDNKAKWNLVLKWIGTVVFLFGIISSLYFANKIGTDKIKLLDTYAILPKLPAGSIINIDPKMSTDWSLHGYYGRYKNISLDPDMHNRRNYLLLQNKYYSDKLLLKYQIISKKTIEYKLLELKICSSSRDSVLE